MPYILVFYLRSSFSVCCMIFLKCSNKSHNMKALIILSHSWSPFFLLTYLYGENELLVSSVHPFGVFSWEKPPKDRRFNIGVYIGISAKISKNTCVWWADNQNKSAPSNIAMLSHTALLLGNSFWLSKFKLEWQFQENLFAMRHF